jgi:putative ATPase
VQRLEAQLQVLDALQRPQILNAPLTDLVAALEPGQRFEWIAARHPWRDASAAELKRQITALTALAAPQAQLRLLFTTPLLGPAGAVLAMGASNVAGHAETLAPLEGMLEPLAAQEPLWLAAPPQPQQLVDQLRRQGWRCELSSWEERLELPVTAGLLERWFQPGARYRAQLEEQRSPEEIALLQQWLSALEGRRLPQRLQHQLLVARQQP